MVQGPDVATGLLAAVARALCAVQLLEEAELESEAEADAEAEALAEPLVGTMSISELAR